MGFDQSVYGERNLAPCPPLPSEHYIVACRLPWLPGSHFCHTVRQGTPAQCLDWHNHWAGGHLDAQHWPQAWQGPSGGAHLWHALLGPPAWHPWPGPACTSRHVAASPRPQLVRWGLLDAERHSSAIKHSQGVFTCPLAALAKICLTDCELCGTLACLAAGVGRLASLKQGTHKTHSLHSGGTLKPDKVHTLFSITAPLLPPYLAVLCRCAWSSRRVGHLGGMERTFKVCSPLPACPPAARASK